MRHYTSGPNVKTGIATWEVEFTEGGDCPIKVEAIGNYTSTPDSGTAMSQDYLVVPTPEPTPSPTPSPTPNKITSVVLLIDASDYMQNNTVYTYLDMLNRALNSLPDTAIEVSAWGYGGDPNNKKSVWKATDFLSPVFYKQRLREINPEDYKNLYIGGRAPLAESLTQVGNYIQNSGKGSSALIIYIGTGIDDCGGDPIKAAKDLNLNIKKLSLNWLPFSGTALAANNIPIKLQVIGMNVTSDEMERRLRDIAEAGQGQYFTVSNIDQLSSTIAEAIESGIAPDTESNFHIWWFISGGATVVFLIMLLLLITFSRRRARVAVQPVPSTISHTAVADTAKYHVPSKHAPSDISVGYCPKCGNQGSEGAVFCTKCGNELAFHTATATATPCPTTIFCSQCGTPNGGGSVCCYKCGVKLFSVMANPSTTSNQQSSQTYTPYSNQVTPKKVSGFWWLLPVFLV